MAINAIAAIKKVLIVAPHAVKVSSLFARVLRFRRHPKDGRAANGGPKHTNFHGHFPQRHAAMMTCQWRRVVNSDLNRFAVFCLNECSNGAAPAG
ncbi:MAG TPA: hypothetical protein VFP60_10455 [Pseudolabrys sp.]|nr:hypothetical protein [Pseudolabrys sp.]